jgi:type II secretory pathway predicted ATPase ExeA
MLTEVMEHYGLAKPLRGAGYYETPHLTQLLKDAKATVYDGGLVAVAGVVGAGKTVLIRRLRSALEKRVVSFCRGRSR